MLRKTSDADSAELTATIQKVADLEKSSEERKTSEKNMNGDALEGLEAEPQEAAGPEGVSQSVCLSLFVSVRVCVSASVCQPP